jgi:N-acetylmuramic acid 6-phosphate etherase
MRPEENIYRLYSAPSGSARIAALAPLVLKAARRGDRVARDIVRDAAAVLAITVRTVIRRLSGGRTRIFRAGGLAAAAPELLGGVRSFARSRGIRLEDLPVAPEIACLNLALRTDGLENRFARILDRVGPASGPGNREERLPVTERANRAAADFSRLPPLGMVRVMNREDARVAPAIGAILPRVARAVSLVERALKRGGRLVYVGAGTSGRLGVLDASEAPPTFGVRPGVVIGLIAGGSKAVTNSVEGAEDDARAGVTDLKRLRVGRRDAVIGLSASGGAAYVIAAVREARRKGAGTVGITMNPGSRLARAASIALVPSVGPEVVAGSTRLKSGTAQKLLLNMISTCAFARIGRVEGNVMTCMTPVNAKLRDRAVRIAAARLGLDPADARRRLESLGWNLPAVLEPGRKAKDR